MKNVSSDRNADEFGNVECCRTRLHGCHISRAAYARFNLILFSADFHHSARMRKKFERDVVVAFSTSTPTYRFVSPLSVIILKISLAGCVCLSWWSVCREGGITNKVFQLSFGFIEIDLLCEVFTLF